MSVQRFEELVARGAEGAGVDEATARQIILAWFDSSREALFQEKSQALPGIGTLHLKWRESYEITNPRTGERQRVPAKFTLRFSENLDMARALTARYPIPVTKAWLAQHPGPASDLEEEGGEMAAAAPSKPPAPARPPVAAPAKNISPAKRTLTPSRREVPMMPPIPPSEEARTFKTGAPVPGPEFSRKALSRWGNRTPAVKKDEPVEDDVVRASLPGLSRGPRAPKEKKPVRLSADFETVSDLRRERQGSKDGRAAGDQAIPPISIPEADPRLAAAEEAILENLQGALPPNLGDPAGPSPEAEEKLLHPARPSKRGSFPVRAMWEGLGVGLVLAALLVVFVVWPLQKRLAQPVVVTIHMPAEAPARPEVPLAKGDTLSSLAARYWGDPRLWVAIYEANKGRLADPDTLVPGKDRVFLPPKPTGSLVENYLTLRESRPGDSRQKQWERLLTAYSLDPKEVARQKHRLGAAERRALGL